MSKEYLHSGWQPEHDDPEVVLSLLRLQSRVLEAIARNEPLQSILNLLCREAEQCIGEAVASVMMLDETRGTLSLAAAPSLPREAWPSLTGLKPSETAGSCGNAIFLGEPVYVCNVAEDSRWDDLRALAQDYSVGACWSYPVFLQSDQPQATFAITSFRQREPDTRDDLLLRVGAHLTGLAISFSQQNSLLKQMNAAIEATSEGICFFGLDRRVTQVNKAFAQMLGYSETVLQEMDIAKLLPDDNRADLLQEMRASLEDFRAWRGELELMRFDGPPLPVIASINRMDNPCTGQPEHVAVVTNIEQIKAHAERLEYLLDHDNLTQFYNRRGVEKALRTELENCRDGEHVGVVCLDLDRFKNINDTFGHKIGDQILQLMSHRLRNAWPDVVMGRQGGDQFLLVFSGLHRIAQLNAILDKLLYLSREPMHVGLSEFLFTATAGVAVYPEDGHSVEALLSCADTALHEAKKQGRDHWLPYHSRQSDQLNRMLDIENALRKDLLGHSQAFQVVYQLQYREDGQPCGMEALVRWRNEQLGAVSPAEFIPLAEETGLVRDLGLVVLRTACEEFLQLPVLWQKQLKLAVNLSRMQLSSELVVAVMDILDATGFDPTRLELEVTETANLQSSATQRNVLLTLQKLGIRFALDDFGTGYSSLTELKRLPVSTLKIDQTLTRDILEDASDAALVRAALALGDALGLDVVAEGVESAEQLQMLKRLGCSRFQGYYFCKPQPLAELQEKITQQS